ncbi:hypothetical protein SEA_REYNAULD_60 [Rhodococcus phage Reynauld]|uniref:Uncharacterized protein n=1 Tax=Rhodococcus phage Reynauld TaxID=3062845 RepID=A0ACD4UI94_9CAUD|nr:hypothetical protein SEA_REYNAULD_60 [Rhodococcus phage Reynauld]
MRYKAIIKVIDVDEEKGRGERGIIFEATIPAERVEEVSTKAMAVLDAALATPSKIVEIVNPEPSTQLHSPF